MGGQGHPHGPFIIGDTNIYTVTFPVETPDLDLWRVFLIEFIPLIAVLEIHTDEAIIRVPQHRGNTAFSGQVPYVLVFPVALLILDGVGSTPIHSEGAAGVIPLHQRLADIQIDGVDSLRPIHPLRHLGTFVAVHNRLPFPVCRQHKGILQLHGGQCIHIGFIDGVTQRKRLILVVRELVMMSILPFYILDDQPYIAGSIPGSVGIAVSDRTQHGGNRTHNKRHLVLILCGGIHLGCAEASLAAGHGLAVQQNLLHAVGVGDHLGYAALNTQRCTLESHGRPAVFNRPAHIAPHIPVSVVHIGEDRAVFADKVRHQAPHHSLRIIQGRARNIVIK